MCWICSLWKKSMLHFKSFKAIELIKTGMAKDSKRCLKLCKARLGTHRRGLLKKIELEEVVRAQRKKWFIIECIYIFSNDFNQRLD